MALSMMEREACIAYLRGARHRQSETVARPRLAKLLQEEPGEIMPLFQEAVGDILYSKAILNESMKRERLLGYLERLLASLLDDRSTGWNAIQECAEKIFPTLGKDLRMLLPMKIAEWRDKKF